MTTGQHIIQLRKRSGLSQEALAMLIGGKIRQKDVSNWERDKHEPGFKTVKKIESICKSAKINKQWNHLQL